MKSLAILLTLLIGTFVASVDSDSHKAPDELNFTITVDDEPPAAAQPVTEAQTASSLQQCRVKQINDGRTLACEAPNQVELENGPLPKVVEVHFTHPYESDCSTHTCLWNNANRTLERLSYVLVNFNYEAQQGLGYAGPLWISRPNDLYTYLQVWQLPGFYNDQNNKNESVIKFSFIIPKTPKTNVNLQAKAVSVCLKERELCTIENNKNIPTIENFGSSFDVLGSPEYESMTIDFQSKEILPIKFTWKSTTSCSQAFSVWDKNTYENTRMDKIFVMIYEASEREDNIQINQKVKPVLFLDSADAECDESSGSDKPKTDYVFEGNSVIYLKWQFISLRDEYLQKGGRIDKGKPDSFYPKWVTIKNNGHYSAHRRIKVAVAFCGSTPIGDGLIKCSEYKVENFLVAAGL